MQPSFFFRAETESTQPLSPDLFTSTASKTCRVRTNDCEREGLNRYLEIKVSSERNCTSCERKERVNVSNKQGGCERVELNSEVYSWLLLVT